MSVGVVTKMVISSAYATTTVFRACFPIRIPGSVWSKMRGSGSTHKAKSSMLMGYPCLTELFIGIGPDKWPLIWMEDAASSYMLFIRSRNQSLNPWLHRMVTRYWWEFYPEPPESLRKGCTVARATPRPVQ